MNFEFSTAQRVLYGRGRLEQLGEVVRPLGQRVFVVHRGSPLEQSVGGSRLKSALAGFSLTSFVVRGEPDLAVVDQALAHARAAQSEVVVGLGGGSVLDTAKAVAGLLTHPGTALDYMEVVGRGQPLVRPAAPMVAIPTTAGTGTEVTKNAVIAAKQQKFKASIRSEYLLPRCALVDPSLTDALPRSVTASTGLDALTQLLEPLVSIRAQPVTDALALRGLELVGLSLKRAFENGADTQARDDMALAALLGGMCLANAGLGAVHGFAAPLGASFPVPHGVACASLLPHVTEANLRALRSRAPESPARARYAQAFSLLVGGDETGERLEQAGIEWLARLGREFQIPRLGDYGILREHVPDLVMRAQQASSMKGNPIALAESELEACLQAAL